MASAGTRKQRERDTAAVRQVLTILALVAGGLAWLSTSNMVVGLVVFIVALVIIESLLLLPDILRRRRLRASGYDEVYAMNGEQFEEYLRALFKANGYRATLTPNGADFGADLILEQSGERTVVQAKHWVKRDVGVSAVQEVQAARAYYKADEAMVVTVGAFTQQAIDLAKACKVELWDGRRLGREVLALSSRRQSVQQQASVPSAVITVPASAPPSCARCGAAMVRRRSQYGEFWGCPGFPTCRGRRPT